jgi:hypothetical protein
MARTIPVASRQRMEDAADGDPILLFVTIRHKTLIDPIPLVLDDVDYVLDGVTYHKSYFELELLTDDDKPPKATFTFPNVNRQPINLLANVVGPAMVDFKLIAASYFDLTVEPRAVKAGVAVEALYSASSLFLTDVQVDQTQVQGTLRGYDFRQESWPSLRATQDRLPGVFMR